MLQRLARQSMNAAGAMPSFGAVLAQCSRAPGCSPTDCVVLRRTGRSDTPLNGQMTFNDAYLFSQERLIEPGGSGAPRRPGLVRVLRGPVISSAHPARALGDSYRERWRAGGAR